MEESNQSSDFNFPDGKKIERARVINRVLYCVGPCHEENLFEYIEDEQEEAVRDAFKGLVDQQVLVKIKDPENPQKSIIQIPVSQYARAKAIVKNAEGINGRELLLSIPPVIIGKWETTIQLLGKDKAGIITHNIKGIVNWNSWRKTTFSIYTEGEEALDDLDISLEYSNDNHDLTYKCLFNADKYKKYLIEFDPAIRAGEEFEYTIRYTIKDTFDVEKDWYEHNYAHSENSLRLKIFFPEGTKIDKELTKEESYIASPGGTILPLRKHLRIGNNGAPKICLKLDALPQGTSCKIKWFTTKE